MFKLDTADLIGSIPCDLLDLAKNAVHSLDSGVVTADAAVRG